MNIKSNRNKLLGEDGETVEANRTTYHKSFMKFPWSKRVESRTPVLENLSGMT